MKIEPLALDGAFRISPELFGDKRGSFGRLFCEQKYSEFGLNIVWAQMNVSRTPSKGTVRGLHYQNPPFAEVKLVRCVKGTVLDVLVDLREDSPSYGKHITIRLCSETLDMVYIPQGFAHGFQALTDDVELHYMHSTPYNRQSESGILLTDTTLAIEWPLPITQMSERDRNLPHLLATKPITL